MFFNPSCIISKNGDFSDVSFSGTKPNTRADLNAISVSVQEDTLIKTGAQQEGSAKDQITIKLTDSENVPNWKNPETYIKHLPLGFLERSIFYPGSLAFGKPRL